MSNVQLFGFLAELWMMVFVLRMSKTDTAGGVAVLSAIVFSILWGSELAR